MKTMKLGFFSYKKEISIIIFLLVISSLVVLPLLKYGFPPTHDGEYHVIRGYQFYKTLQDGDFYPRWLPDLNYGYGIPLLNYYYPLPYYMMSLFHFFGASFIDSFKLGIITATLTGTIFFFLWARMFWDNIGGFVASLFYTFAPYHIVEIYVRGAAGEVWSLAFFPAFLWSITKLIKEQKTFFLPISSIFLTLIIFSHNILALMFFPFALAYIVFLLYHYKKLQPYATVHTLLAIVFALGLSAIFWLPALLERGYVTGLKIYNIEENFPELYQLLFPSWGTGFSNTDLGGQMSFQIGVANLLAIGLSILALFLYKDKIKRWIIVLFLSLFLLIFLLMLEISFPLWKTIPLLNYFQFPWRFLSLEILIASFLAGSIFPIITAHKAKIVAFIAAIISILLVSGYITPAYYWERDDSYYITRPNFIDSTNTPGNFFNTTWFNKSLSERKREKFEIIEGIGQIIEQSVKSTAYKIAIFAESDLTIRVNTAYFPGWQVFVDGKRVIIGVDQDGLIQFTTPPGDHEIKVKFLNTIARSIASITSFLSLIIISLLFVRSLRAKIRG